MTADPDQLFMLMKIKIKKQKNEQIANAPISFIRTKNVQYL